MTKPALHPWLSTPEAVQAAHAATGTPWNKLPKAAQAVGIDELFSEALIILTECALPPRDRGHFACAQCGKGLENVRAGAKFCSGDCRYKHANSRRDSKAAALPATPKSHIGSMWSWPEAQRSEYAVRQVGYALLNWVRTRPREDLVSHDAPEFIAPAWSMTAPCDVHQEVEDREYGQALEAFGATGKIPWNLLSDEDFDRLSARMGFWTRRDLTLCAARSAA